MTLLTKPAAEKLVKQASSVASIPATTKDVQVWLAIRFSAKWRELSKALNAGMRAQREALDA